MNVFDLFAKISLDTRGYEASLRDAKGMASGIGDVFGKVAGVAGDALKSAGKAAVSFVSDSVKTGQQFDAAMSQVAATMGKTVGEIGDLRDFAREMGAQTQYSATEAAEALNYMALAGYNADESMQMLPTVLNLAAAGSFDLARASDMVTDTQTAFGITMERTAQLVDEMAKAASTGNTSVEQLGDAFLTVGGLAQELNGGFVTLADGTKAPLDGVQELETALTAMANAGIKGSEAGTHMRNMLLKLASPTKDGIEAFDELGVSVFDSEGKMRSLSGIFGDLSGKLGKLTQQDKLNAISKIFNTRDTAAAEALLAAVGEDWDEIGAAILEAEGAAEQMANTQLDNLAGDVTTFKSALDEAKITVSDIFAPALRELVRTGTEGLRGLTEAYKKDGLKGLFETAKADLDSVGKKVGETVDRIAEAAPEFASGAVGMMTKFAEKLTSPEALGKVLEKGHGIVHGILDGITSKEALDQLTDPETGVVKIIENIGSGLVQFAGNMLEDAKTVIRNLGDYLNNEENRKQLFESAKEVLTKFCKGLTSQDAKDAVGGIIVEAARFLANTFVGGIDWDAEGGKIAKQIVAGVYNNLWTTRFGTWIGEKLSDEFHEDELNYLDHDTDSIFGAGGTGSGGSHWAPGAGDTIKPVKFDVSELNTGALAAYNAAHGYASGFVADRPTWLGGNTLVGEAGTEALIPLESNTQWMDIFADKLGARMGGGVVIEQVIINAPSGRAEDIQAAFLDTLDEALRNRQITQNRGIGAVVWQT